MATGRCGPLLWRSDSSSRDFLARFSVDREVPLPPVGPSVEQICAETMKRSTPDLSWVVQDREEKIRGREIKTATLDDLPPNNGNLLRGPECCTWNSNGWRSTCPALRWRIGRGAHHGSRLVRSGQASQIGGKQGGHRFSTDASSSRARTWAVRAGISACSTERYEDVLRLDVWSTPHRPLVTSRRLGGSALIHANEKRSSIASRTAVSAVNADSIPPVRWESNVSESDVQAGAPLQ